MNIEKAIYNEMIHCCFENSKKRKKFQRVFKSWTQEERDSFLKGLGIYVRNARTIKFKEGVGFKYGEREDYISSWIISRREPLI